MIGDSTSPYTNSGTLVNNATINWGGGGILSVGTASALNSKITNSGSFNISDATLQVNGDFGANSGSLTIGNSSDAIISGKLTNTGTVNVQGSSQLTAATLNTNGTVSVGAGSFLKVGMYAISAGTTDIAGTLNSLTFTQTGGTPPRCKDKC